MSETFPGYESAADPGSDEEALAMHSPEAGQYDDEQTLDPVDRAAQEAMYLEALDEDQQDRANGEKKGTGGSGPPGRQKEPQGAVADTIDQLNLDSDLVLTPTELTY